MFRAALRHVLSKFRKKNYEPIVVEFDDPIEYGSFMNISDENLKQYSKQIYNEEMDMVLNFQFMCACGDICFYLSDEVFGCLHCDSICNEIDCEWCEILMKTDFGAPSA